MRILVTGLTGSIAGSHLCLTLLRFFKLYGKPLNTWADIPKANRLLGYGPKVSLEEGLSIQVDYINKADKV
ncbi:hypothetical protein [Peribacillus sp. SCS-155]|uniref:hypothetical protein n=1 Tax=Peribacillus sedimenti TaxID=3115297 RepID=UPI003906212C